jgi:alkylation response protein AidB-like acyl-CoA dehydrogenase
VLRSGLNRADRAVHHGAGLRLAVVELAALMTAKAALHDRGAASAAGEAANMAKYAAAEVSLAALDVAIQTHGMSSEYGLLPL